MLGAEGRADQDREAAPIRASGRLPLLVFLLEQQGPSITVLAKMIAMPALIDVAEPRTIH
jgi:hypothetical protein